VEGLTPGDKLHEGKLHGVFTNDLHWELIGICGIEDGWAHVVLSAALCDITEDYGIFAEFERQHGPFGPHLRRLAEIGKLAKRLGRLLAAEPLDWRLMWPSVTPKNYDFRAEIMNYELHCEAAEMLAHTVQEALASIEQVVTPLAANPDQLRRWRYDKSMGPEKSAATGKSAERRFIWEPTFELWVRLGHSVGYSENGPVMRFLRVVHEALGIPAPKGNAVRQAIDDFNGRPRLSKKKSRPGARGRA
jgi:hypothetical protein